MSSCDQKLLLVWTRGKREVRISANQITEISQRLVQLRHFIPSIFARKPRGLDELDHWKATEFRQFVLYTGKFVLKDILRPELYDHFMTLSVALDILVSKDLVWHHLDYADNLLWYFVQQGRVLYGPEVLAYNIHTMLHLSLDAQEFGCLDSCAAFPFESYLHQVKKLVRSLRSKPFGPGC